MNRVKFLISNSLFVITILLIFLLLFEEKLHIPIWLQPLGRMHPLLLHLPIGFLLFTALLTFFKKEMPTDAFQKLESFSLHITALTASLTALMGLFLAQEEGYDTNLVNWHKWLGVSVSFMTYALLLWHNQFSYYTKGYNIALFTNVIILIIAGHLGATITHGDNYLLAPIQKDKPIAITNDTPIFAAFVQPILEAKCYNCHNESKAKGDLIMTSLESLLQGGKHGALWLAGNSDSSLIMNRLWLPLEHEDHMPPQEKPQLTQEELQLMQAWIDAGADYQMVIKDLQPTDTLFTLVNIRQQSFQNKPSTDYTFNFAAEKKIKALNTPFRTVHPIALGSPALHAEIFVQQAYQPQFLSELLSVKEQLVSLNLTNMPIQNEDLKTIAQLQQLEKLILNGTGIDGQQLEALKKLKKLQALSLSNTAVTQERLKILKDFSALKEVFVWNTALSQEALSELQKMMPTIQWHGGYVPDTTEVLQLNPPLLKNKASVLAKGELVVLETKLQGVTTRYTTDGSEPDSLTSPVYTQPIRFERFTILKVKNFRPQWKSSEVKSFTFFPKGHTIDSVHLNTAPEPFYQSKGARTLYDEKKGNINNVINPLWLGFKDQPMDAFFYFNDAPPTVKEILVSIGKNINSRGFLPAKIEVWGGQNTKAMQRLAVLTPQQPTSYEQNEIKAIQIAIPASNFPCYRILAYPLARTPDWHFDKKYNPRMLVDEVFFY